jgi:hypothetical protein
MRAAAAPPFRPAIRKLHPSGPMLVVLDFLQLVGSEPVVMGALLICESGSVRRHTAAVTLPISMAQLYSSSRAPRAASTRCCRRCKGRGSDHTPVPGARRAGTYDTEPRCPDGCRQESGEIEYAAESQTVPIRWPTPLDNGERPSSAPYPSAVMGHQAGWR